MACYRGEEREEDRMLKKGGDADAPVVTVAELPRMLPRAGFAGVLMGLANLVPGISGGTMLLAAGVYPQFIGSIAEVSRFKFRPASLVVLGTIVVAALAAIALLSGVVVRLVVGHQWIMYSVFIGLTLGGLPMVYALARPMRRATWIGAIAGFVVMAGIAVAQQAGMGAGAASGGTLVGLLLAGAAAAAAMVLPGISGSYLLLVLGQYVHILDSVDALKDAVAARDVAAALATWRVVVPVGIGVVVGIVGVSNLLKWVMARFEHATLGVLMGLLVGAVAGLWPFQERVAPVPGDVIKATVVTEENLSSFDPKDWGARPFRPSAAQVAGSVGLIAVGFGLTLVVARVSGSGSGRGDAGERPAEGGAAGAG
jgi:putative membrane protein